MNEAATAQRSDVELNLGTEFSIDLGHSSNSPTNYTIEQVIAALEMTTSLTDVTVDFDHYVPTPEDNRRIVEPLCRCLSNLRCRNEHHPLRALTLEYARIRSHAGMLDVFGQFLIAATKYGGISHVKLDHVQYLPIQFLLEFCRDNNNLKAIAAHAVSFSDGRAEMSLPPNRTQDSSVMLALDKLSLSNVSLENSTAVTAFANLISRMTVQAMEIGYFWSTNMDKITARIFSEIKIPSVKQLELNRFCRIEHFKAALEAGRSSLVELDVNIDVYDKDDDTERLALLANFIRRAVQLNSLTIRTDLLRDQPITPPRALLRAIELCATVTRIQVDNDGEPCFSRDDVQRLQGITARNEELGRFVACPSTYPTENLLGLIRQFENCPTGRYMLSRNLPVVFSFEKIVCTDLSTTEPNPKKKKISHNSRSAANASGGT